MSYILDALKKAETERKMGTAPEAHAIPVFGGWQYEARERRRKRWLWTLAATLASALVGLAWLHWRQPLQSMSLPAPATPQPRQPVAAPAPTVPALPSEAIAPPPEAPAVPARPALIHGTRHAHARNKPEEKTRSNIPAKPKMPPPATEALPLTLHELPAAIRQQIPSLATNGYLYSGNPADRSVVLNNKLLREGDQVAPGLTLERLLPNGMVLNYQGHRFRTGY